MKKKFTLVCLILSILFISFNCSNTINNSTLNSLIPKKLLIYYGYPSLINGSTSIEESSVHFGKYDYVVLGAGLEDDTHGDHDNTVDIISHNETRHTIFFGYIDLGVTTNNYSLTVIQQKVDNWKAAGIDGIFLDDYGYDFGVTRERQNNVVDYIHQQGLSVTANAWNPDDTFSSAVHANNPGGLSTSLGSNDFYLSESYQISTALYQAENDWYNKAQKVKTYQELFHFKILSVTTNDSSDVYSESKFFYAWYSAALYNHEAVGWGEYWFSSNDNAAVFRTRPVVESWNSYTGNVINSTPEFYRDSNNGRIRINTSTHEYGLNP